MNVDVTAGAVAVVGGGVIGLSVAWRLAESGYRVVLVDPAPRSGGSWVAGGMLAPVTESWPGEEEVLALGSASLARWPDFAERLRAAGGDPGLRTEGTLAVALDSADAETLAVLADHLRELGREVERLSGRQLRALEPGLGSRVRSGLHVPGDLAVDTRETLRALHAAAAGAGVEFVTVAARSVGPNVVELADESTVECAVVVITAGAWSGGLHPGLAGLVRPVKGEILRLRARPGALPVPTRTIRAHVESRPVYLVPRESGELVLGATQHEVGFDTEVTAASVLDLLRDAQQVLPGIGEYALTETAAGLRAGSPDNLPIIGVLEPGVLVATGHHRNGLLLAPVTAEAVLSILRAEELPAAVRAADPSRLRGVPALPSPAGGPR
ncbi:glycine oxidase ThiO [Actinokineospora sp. NBRC 105648]|uniref:glycine oxidase ThiO n=1 Tax=Actinokineospora sp. NBRC 105648 TaxID=3032206 RepID=UPI00249F9D9E|nr:glycine oxidase ThiO [Actinokineospora sp. NBRC 105648]GLZ41555.1 glycine oxidase ThiO [Actinokineospora sp. NBRC 105648]